MFRDNYREWSGRLFADQFEPDGQNFIYRRSMKGAPIPVSAAERDRYIGVYAKFQKYSFWGTAIGTGVLIISFATYAVAIGVEPPMMTIYIGLGAIVAVSMAGHYWSWNLPARELRDRGVVGEARSRAETRRLVLARMTYGQIAIGAGAGIFFLLKARSGGDMFSGWNLFWTCFAIAALILSAVQAFRKWRLESRQP